MDSEVISSVSRKVPGWFNRIFGWSDAFHTTDKCAKAWTINCEGKIYCEETGEMK
jgi:hypothetical protein